MCKKMTQRHDSERNTKRITAAGISEVPFPTSVLGGFYSTTKCCYGLNNVFSQGLFKYKPSVPVTVILFGNRVFFAEVIKLR